MSTLTALVHTGVSEQQPEYLQNKIKLANRIVLLLMAIVLPYGLVIHFNLPELSWFIVVCGAIYASALLFNYWGWYVVSRLTLSIAPQIIVSVLHGILLQQGEPLLITMAIFHVALFILPWMLLTFGSTPSSSLRPSSESCRCWPWNR